VVAGRVARLGHAVLDLQVRLAATGDLAVPAPAFACFFTERALPDPTDRSVVRELYASTMADIALDGVFHGPATLALHAPELVPLRPTEILGGRVNTVSWTKDRATLVARRVVPSAG
jgi:hypothetical protein